jgi:hypothetical protein
MTATEQQLLAGWADLDVGAHLAADAAAAGIGVTGPEPAGAKDRGKIPVAEVIS